MQAETWRLVIFLFVLIACAVWEKLLPRKKRTQAIWLRWINNLGLVGLNSLLVTILMPVVAFSAAQWAQEQQFGLMYWLTVPSWLALLLCLVILDAIIYAQHVLFHYIPSLWRLHRMHHADQDIDVTTGARFHPIEIILSVGIKIIAVVILGASPLTVLLFEIILNASAMFNHSNAKLGLTLDKWLRKVVVTPDMHRVHHSIVPVETHANFGFCLSIWDQWFATYRAQPERGHDKMIIGLPDFQNPREQWLDKMLTQPFRRH
ncbi:sterol desaturase family protein [Vibrio sp. V27_P1S3P104]|uniref:sterol desaturase family protein n=1 Tax=Vibrio TaxID=662 RepID=UPI000C1694F7|nr:MULTISPECIES: sterol desaturase family protein [Vibrio]NAW69921.1 sterol desaturase family protein [Vibrio sp. V28_P6S34P95]NAX04680.1 sterol desaturase family protein [Vibrio sp. V30_P3S12P165]NAX33185.1 sterol desaturase family protein [Vibrio sp. V29_P1S30P107]NAX37582.1 sterol desaturase family protein [Vibrio sp. V27_P1S3P104]NAX39815.1 sterol desaturase family protein [Vibrio sp. V26_P1S5P106]